MNGPLEEAVEEHTCRICRTEATNDQPLFYPCKCRGSIKYIHQDCLEEWLKHSNKKEATCDICHQKYKFTTVYADNTPDRVPLGLILKKLQISLCGYGKHLLMMFELVFGCCIQIPLFWAATSRLLTWILYGVTLHDSFVLHMIYGDSPYDGDGLEWWDIAVSLAITYINSLLTILLVGIITVVFYFEYEKVVKDPGFSKLVKRNIGEERVTRNANPRNFWGNPPPPPPVVQDAPDRPEGRRIEEALRNLENLQRLVQDVEGLDNPVVAEAVDRLLQRHVELRRQLEDQAGLDDGVHGGLLPEEDLEQDPDFIPDDESDSDNDTLHSDDEIDEVAQFERFARFEAEELAAGARIRALGAAAAVQHAPAPLANVFPDIPDVPNNNRIDQINRNDGVLNANAAANGDNQPNEPFFNFGGARPIPANIPVQLHRPAPNGREFIAEPAPAAQPLPAQDQMFNFEGEAEDFLASLHLETVIAVADAVIALYLILVYCIPSVVGTILYQLVFFLASISEYLKQSIPDFDVSGIPFYHPAYIQYLMDQVNLHFYGFIPLTESIKRVYDQNVALTPLERMIPICLFYGLGFVSVLLFLRWQEATHSAANPLLGLQRKLYVFWFGMLSTLKVFTVFTMELVVFPAFCGFLLLFVMSPVIQLGPGLEFFGSV